DGDEPLELPEDSSMSRSAAIHPFPNPPRAVRRGITSSRGGIERMLLPNEATQPQPALRALPESGSFTLSKPYRPAWAEVDLNAIRHNVGHLARLVAPAGAMAAGK